MSHRVKIELEIYEEIAVCMVTYVWLNCKLAKSGSTNYSRVSNNSTNVSSCQLCTAQIKRSQSIHILSIQIDTKISNRVIPLTFWTLKLIQDIKRSHSIHMLSIQIDTKIAKILKLVIHHYFKNIKLSFFASHIKRSFPLLVALRLLDTLE